VDGRPTNGEGPMQTDQGAAMLVAVTALVLSGLLGLGVAVVALRLRAIGLTYRRVFAGASSDVLQVLARHEESLQRLDEDLQAMGRDADELRELLRGTVSRVGLVRYDAFDDMGGALSFSAALLDDRSDGVVISAINGRTETRCYAKAVAGGVSEHNLSDEELEALDAALRSSPPIASPDGRRRGRAS
jgi:hypothetical protein